MAEGKRPDLRQIAHQVIALLEGELARAGYDLLDVRVFQGGGRFQVRVFVDLPVGAEDRPGTTGGISLDQVAAAGRTAGMLLEEADLFAGQYVIEVSSPGIRRPLRKPEHYRRAVGEKVDLKVRGSRRLRGVLEAVAADELVVQPRAAEGQAPAAATEAVRVEISRVVEGNLDPDFDAQAIINADRRERKESKRRQRLQRKGPKKRRPKNRPQKDGGST